MQIYRTFAKNSLANRHRHHQFIIIIPNVEQCCPDKFQSTRATSAQKAKQISKQACKFKAYSQWTKNGTWNGHVLKFSTKFCN